MKNKNVRKARSKPKMDSGVEEELAKQPINIEDYTKSPLDTENEVIDKPRRRYKPRAPKASNPGFGDFLAGAAQLFTNALNGVLGEDVPLTEPEKKMLEVTGNSLEAFGEMEDFNEQMGKYGWYLVAGSFIVIAGSRIIPAIRKRRNGGLLPAQVVE